LARGVSKHRGWLGLASLLRRTGPRRSRVSAFADRPAILRPVVRAHGASALGPERPTAGI